MPLVIVLVTDRHRADRPCGRRRRRRHRLGPRLCLDNATRIRATIARRRDGTKVYRIEGPLFFGSAAGFQELFTPENDPDRVIVDFMEVRVADQSALQAIEALAEKYDAVGTRLELLHLSRDCHALLARAGQLMVDSDDDPDYGVAVHYGVRIGRFGDAH